MVMHYIVIVVFVTVNRNLLDQHVNAQRYRPIALVQIAKCQTMAAAVRKMSARATERANAISANVRTRIPANSARAHTGMRHLIRCVHSTKRAYNVS